MSMLRWMTGLALAASLAGCSLPTGDPKAEALAKGIYDQVRKGQDDAVIQEMVPAQRTPALPAAIAQLRTVIPEGEPKTVTQRGISFNASMGQGESITYVFAYDYGDKTAVSQVIVFRAKSTDPWLVQGLHVNTEVNGAATPAEPPPPAVGGSVSTKS